jgi:hypothetical protein
MCKSIRVVVQKHQGWNSGAKARKLRVKNAKERTYR